VPQANLFLTYAAHFPDAEAEFLLTEDGRRLTYGNLELASAQLAQGLVAQGLRPGDRLTACCEKSPDFIVLYLASLRAGLVFHPLNPGYTAAEIQFFIGDARPGLVVGDSDTVATLVQAAAGHGVRVLELGTLIAESANAPTSFATVERSADDLAALLYSSGTTGKPKGIMLTHANLAANAAALTEAWGFSRNDVLLHLLPLFHVHGLFIALGCTLMSGSRLLFGSRFDLDLALRWLPECTVMMGVPTHYTRLLAHPGFDAGSTRKVRLFTSGSAPLLADTWQDFKARTGHPVLERYGMTETGVITTNPLVGERRPGAVGLALAGVSVRVVDAQDHPVAPGEIGHVQTRGASVFKGYWEMPEKTRQDFTAEGWFRTGDDGVLDTQGYLTLVGRAKDLVITGGLNVYPSEVEAVIDEHPAVLESAVIGLPHADFGEQVVAMVVLRKDASFDEAALRTWVRKHLAAFKCPKAWHVLDELPRNAMGKVQKNVLRERARV
jgi:malonyl-CoA/methylmalonyl-CoA synthetase